MANTRQPGPMCQVFKAPVVLDDGTLCRCESPLPGVIGEEPEVSDHFLWPVGVDTSKPLGEEVWFEQRYPDLLEDARLRFTEVINGWVQSNWGNSPFTDQKQRINVSARDTAYRNADGSIRQVKKSDNRFERCGDQPQTPHEADKVLGSFALDIETPVPITYSSKSVGGKTIQGFEWTAVMYVEDVLGLQESNNVVQQLGNWTLSLAPSRRVKRARWYIHGEGRSYVVMAGDTLSKIASALCGDMESWKQIHEANRAGIPDPNRITPGQRIFIPMELLKP